jgi:hypothetical protein
MRLGNPCPASRIVRCPATTLKSSPATFCRPNGASPWKHLEAEETKGLTCVIANPHPASGGQSDNDAEEVPLRIIGGPAVVQSSIRSLGITAFQLIDSEHDLDRDESLQYRDWIEPAAAVQLLQRLVHNPPISPVLAPTGYVPGFLQAPHSRTRLAVLGLMEGSPPPPTTWALLRWPTGVSLL